jgi:ubiquinone/menaquinone biosynthesis C-methylase UbiE
MYDESVKPLTGYPQKLAEHLVQRFLMKKNDRMLDVGCGRGEMSRSFQELGLSVSAVDISDMALDYAPTVDFRVADIDGRLPFENDSFDIVFSKSVVEHVDRPENLMAEIYRILKPGGRVITMCPSWIHQYREFYSDYTHRRPFTKESLSMVQSISGFCGVRTEHFRQIPVLWRIPSLLALAEITRTLVPRSLGRNVKWIRFSREIMLLSVGVKPVQEPLK